MESEDGFCYGSYMHNSHTASSERRILKLQASGCFWTSETSRLDQLAQWQSWQSKLEFQCIDIVSLVEGWAHSHHITMSKLWGAYLSLEPPRAGPSVPPLLLSPSGRAKSKRKPSAIFCTSAIDSAK